MNVKKLCQNYGVVLMGKPLHFLAFFFGTLISYYNYELGFAPFILLSILIYFILAIICLIRYDSFPSRFLSVAFLFLPILFWALIVSTLSFYPFLYSRLIVFVFFLLISFYLDTESKSSYINLLYSVKLSLKLHLIAFFIQASYFYTTNKVIDFIEPITGEVSRVYGGSYNPVIGNEFVRLSGLFAEPGTYVSVVFTLFLFYKILSQTVNNFNRRNISSLDFFVLLSVLLTFSTFGYVFIVLYCLINLLKFNFKSIIVLFLLLGGIFFFSYEYFFQRFFSEDQYLYDYRLELIMSFLFNNFEVSKLFLGNGYFSDFRETVPYVVDDVGLWFSILFNFGLFIFIYLIACVSRIWSNLSKLELTLLVVLFISKLNLTYIFAVFYLLFLFHKKIIIIQGNNNYLNHKSL